jgi:hypothetical protein
MSSATTPFELQSKEIAMQDVIYVAIGIAFFLLAIGYVRFCDRVK